MEVRGQCQEFSSCTLHLVFIFLRQGLSLSLALTDQQVPGIPYLCSSPLFPTTITQVTGWHHHVWLLTWVHPCSGGHACAASPSLAQPSPPATPGNFYQETLSMPSCSSKKEKLQRLEREKGTHTGESGRSVGACKLWPPSTQGSGSMQHKAACLCQAALQRENLLRFHNPSARLYWGGETTPTER